MAAARRSFWLLTLGSLSPRSPFPLSLPLSRTESSYIHLNSSSTTLSKNYKKKWLVLVDALTVEAVRGVSCCRSQCQIFFVLPFPPPPPSSLLHSPTRTAWTITARILSSVPYLSYSSTDESSLTDLTDERSEDKLYRTLLCAAGAILSLGCRDQISFFIHSFHFVPPPIPGFLLIWCGGLLRVFSCPSFVLTISYIDDIPLLLSYDE